MVSYWPTPPLVAWARLMSPRGPAKYPFMVMLSKTLNRRMISS